MPRSTRDADVSHDLRQAIHRTGYYPEVVADGVFSAAGGEEVVSYFVHHETTFDHEEVRRHLTALLLTPTRLVIAHTDEHPGDVRLTEPQPPWNDLAKRRRERSGRRGHGRGGAGVRQSLRRSPP